jgi:hypothetical protein
MGRKGSQGRADVKGKWADPSLWCAIARQKPRFRADKNQKMQLGRLGLANQAGGVCARGSERRTRSANAAQGNPRSGRAQAQSFRD